MARFPVLTHTVLCASAALLCSACSHQMSLVNARVSPPALTAQLGPRPARFYIDRVKTPVLEQHRIGKRKNLAGDFASWITTDTDLGVWAHNELNTFLVRHRQSVVPRAIGANYTFHCEITSVSVSKKYDAVWNDDFSAHVEFSVIVKERASGKPVCAQRVTGDYFVERPYDDNGIVTDDEMCNRCLSMAFQKALEQLAFREPRVAKPINYFPVIKPL